MKKTIFIQLISLLPITTIFCDGNSKMTKFKIENTRIDKKVDLKKFEQSAHTLITNFFGGKNINIQNVPAKMQNELLFKKDILIRELDNLDKSGIDSKTKATKAQNITANIFEEFVKQIKYVQISEWNNKMVAAIKSKKANTSNSTNCSFPEIEPNKIYLLTELPK